MVFSFDMKTWAERFYKSTAWKKCRDSYMKSVSGLCEDCYAKGIVNPAEEVHHITFLTRANINDPNVTLNWNNLVALCRECHRKRHGYVEQRYTIQPDGRVLPK